MNILEAVIQNTANQLKIEKASSHGKTCSFHSADHTSINHFVKIDEKPEKSWFLQVFQFRSHPAFAGL